MRKTRSLAKWTAWVMTAVAFCAYGVGVEGVLPPGGEASEPRADIVTIDAMKAFGKLERPPVTFLHTRHTRAVAENGKDCQACHLPDKNERLSLKFKRLEDSDRGSVMDNYHLNCIGCHKEMTTKEGNSGPAECGECHVRKPVRSNRVSMTFDRSLHFRHAKAMDNKCERCHHDYDARAKKLFYNKGKEGSCRYCHMPETEENRISMRQTSHLECIACHRRVSAQQKKAGPAECVGCHAPEKRQMIKKIADKEIPRMERNQPDTVLIRTSAAGTPDGATGPPAPRMAPVPFSHKGHEQYNDTCQVCHHADLNACNTCHTQTGGPKGKNVTLEQAMHRPGNRQSCIGCHEEKQNDPLCAGCHAAVGRNVKPREAACKTCHTSLPAGETAPGDPAAEQALAAAMLASRASIRSTYDAANIPEKVIIKPLVEQYEAVEMPHRKIVQTLTGNIRENPIAQYFHMEKGTVCQGCHHNSPASDKPPLCGSCHGKPFDDKEIHKPGLMAAYHRQCMDCHETMGIAKPDSRDCTACHLKKKAW